MKIVAIYKKPLKGDDRLFPRDIRNYVASICRNDADVHEELMAHKRVQPTFIFAMPNRKSFAIYSFKRDQKTKDMMVTIRKRIEENSNIRVNGVSADVGKARLQWGDHFSSFREGVTERRLRSPLIIASQEFEYAICRKLSVDGKVDYQKLEEFAIEKIKETVWLMARDWYGEDEAEAIRDILDSANISFKEIEYTPIKYKENEYYPAVRGIILSDIELPQFIGYKAGLGYGELDTLKEMERRSRKRG